MISRLFSSEVVKWCYKSTYIILPFSEQTKTERCSVNPVWEYLVVASLLSVFLCLNLPKGLTSSLASPSFPHSVQFLLHITAVSLWRLPASVSSTVPWIGVLLWPSRSCCLFSWVLPVFLWSSCALPGSWTLVISKPFRSQPVLFGMILLSIPLAQVCINPALSSFLSLGLEYPTLCRTSLTSVSNAIGLNAPSPLQKLLFP